MKKISLLIMTGLAGIITAFADITISPTSRDWTANGGGATVSTLGSGSWTATTDVSWITLVKSTGTAGDACSYLVAKNPDADARVGHITIAGMVFTVTQQGCSVELSPASATFSCTGGLGKFTAIMDVAVTWTASPSDSWIKISPSSGIGPTEISYAVAAFDEVGSRTGTIRIGSDSFTINQTGVDVTLSPTVTNITKDVCIVPVQVVAMTGVRWTVTPNVSWISVLDGGSGFGGSQITLVAAENPSVAKRTGTVSVGSATLTVIQEGTDDVSFRILPEVAEASPNGAFGNVAVYATPDATWSAESLDDWIRITAGAEGAGNGNVKYVTLSNPEQTNRTGHIKFTPPAVTPDFDLYAGLLFWIKEQTNIEGNEERKTTYPLSKVFDGSFSNPLTGAVIPAKDEDDYTLSFSFKVGELDCVNRLLKIGGHTVYLDEDNVLYYHTVKTDFTVESAERYYSLVFRVAGDRRVTVYAGEKDSELHAVWSGSITGQLTFVNPLAMSTFNLGYGEMPSAGYLHSGQFANIRFWTRALTDRECECVDTRQNEMLEIKPGGVGEDVKYDFFPLNGNVFGADETASGPILPSKNHISGSGWKTTSSRTRVRECALTSEGNGLVEIHQFGEIVDKTKVVTNANSIVRSDWGNGRLIYIGNTFTADDSKDATYMMWMNLNTMPADEVALLSRKMSSLPIYEKLKARPGLSSVCQDLDSPEWAEYFAGKLLNNFNLEVFLEKDGALRVKQSSARVSNNGWVDLYPGWMSSHYYAKYKLVENETTNIDITNTGISPDKWMMIALVCKAERSITIFIDGTEVGSLPTSMTFGWLPPFDISTNEQQNQYGDHIYRYETQHEYVFSVGGWNGAFDELTIYQKALSAKEVQAAYDAGLPAQDVYHTVKQGIQQLELSVDRIEIGKTGGASNVILTVANGVKWTVVPDVDWLSVAGSPSGAGSANLNVQIAPNPTIVQRTGTMQIGAKTLTVVQEGLNCAVTVDQTLFDVESSMGVIEVSPEQNGSWTISTDVDWISLAVDSGIGSADVYFFVDYFDDPDMSRTGTITVGDKSIYITQRGYELSIEPMIANVG